MDRYKARRTPTTAFPGRRGNRSIKNQTVRIDDVVREVLAFLDYEEIQPHHHDNDHNKHRMPLDDHDYGPTEDPYPLPPR